MSKRNRSMPWGVLITLWCIGLALAMAYFESAHAAILALASLIFFEGRHPSKELVAVHEQQQVSRQVEQLLVDIKTTLEDMKTEITEVKTEIAAANADLAEVKSTVGDLKTKLEDEDDS